jgi:hypothetical protein
MNDPQHHDPDPPSEADPGVSGPPHDVHDFTGPLTPRVASLLKWFGAACIGLFAVDFAIERKTHAPFEGFPGFYAVYGFVGCVLLVLLAKELRKIVMREEDYYERKGGR